MGPLLLLNRSKGYSLRWILKKTNSNWPSYSVIERLCQEPENDKLLMFI